MADYNIYIHGDSSMLSSKTKPFSDGRNKSTSPKNKENNFDRQFSAIISKVANPDSIVSMAISTVMKATPIALTSYAVLKLTDKIINEVESFKTAETGDYRFQTSYNNFKIGVGALFTPFKTTMDYLHANQQYRIENAKREMQIELLGDSYLNQITRKGV